MRYTLIARMHRVCGYSRCPLTALWYYWDWSDRLTVLASLLTLAGTLYGVALVASR